MLEKDQQRDILMSQKLLPTKTWAALEKCTHATNQHTLQGVLSMFDVVTEPELGHTCPDHAVLHNS